MLESNQGKATEFVLLFIEMSSIMILTYTL